MSYPQQPYQTAPPQQQQGYQQQNGYGGQPGYGQQPPYPPQQGYQQPYPPSPQYQQPYPPQPQPQQGFMPQNPPAGYEQYRQGPPGPPPEQVRGTLQGFMDQPSSGNNSLSFMTLGTRYVGTVIRSVTDADISPQTDMITGAIGTYSDGRVKLVMKIPLLVQPSAQFPDGTATWYVKGHDRDELTRAMEAAGVEADPATGRLYPPRAGDMIDVTYVSDRPGKRGMNPTKVKRVVYAKGNGIAPQVPQQVQQQPAQPAYSPQGQQQPQFQDPYAAYAAQQPAQQPAMTSWGQQAPQYPQPQQWGAISPQPQQFQPQAPQGPDPALAYQQATGQPMPQQPFQPQPGVTYASGPPAGPAPAPQHVQQFPPQPGPVAQTAPQQFTNGAAPTGPAFPSNEPPADWPQGVPFIPGLTPAQAAVAATMHHPAAGPVQ